MCHGDGCVPPRPDTPPMDGTGGSTLGRGDNIWFMQAQFAKDSDATRAQLVAARAEARQVSINVRCNLSHVCLSVMCAQGMEMEGGGDGDGDG